MPIIVCCNSKREEHEFRTIEKDGFKIQGYFINDSILDGTAIFYNTNNEIVFKKTYKKGVLDGIFEEYYPNSNVKFRSTYKDGLKHGESFFFDSLEACKYSDFYFFNLPVGPITYFQKAQLASRFIFVSLENKTVLDIDYSSWNGIEKYVRNFITYTYVVEKSDPDGYASLLLYIINPPKFMTNYALYKRSKNSIANEIFVMDLNSKNPFFQSTLPLPDENSYYIIKLDVYDSILNKRTIINREVY